MAPATAALLTGIPPSHLPGLAGGAGALLIGRLRGRRDALDALLLATAGIHLGLTVGHITAAPSLAFLFLLDGLAFLVAVALPRERWWWRPATGALLAATIVAYLVAIGVGREAADPSVSSTSRSSWWRWGCCCCPTRAPRGAGGARCAGSPPPAPR